MNETTEREIREAATRASLEAAESHRGNQPCPALYDLGHRISYVLNNHGGPFAINPLGLGDVWYVDSYVSFVGRKQAAFETPLWTVLESRPADYLSAHLDTILPPDWTKGRLIQNLREWVGKSRPKLEAEKDRIEKALTIAARRAWRAATWDRDPDLQEPIPRLLREDQEPEGWSALRPFFRTPTGERIRLGIDPMALHSEGVSEEEKQASCEAIAEYRNSHPLITPESVPAFGFVDWASAPGDYPQLQELWKAHWPNPRLYRGLEALFVAFDLEEWEYLATYDGPWLDLLAELWVEDVQAEEKRPPGIYLLRDRAEGQHTTVPSVVAPMAWAFGGAYEGHALEPGAASLVPVSYAARGVLMPENPKRPSQMALALSLESKGAPFFQVSTKKNPSAVALKPEAAKLAMLLFPFGEGRQRITLGELGKHLYSGVKRIRADRELVKVAQALETLDSLFYYLPDQTKVRCFDVSLPWTPGHASAEMEIDLGLSASFLGAISAQTRTIDKLWAARFVFNLSGYLALPNDKAAPLRILPMTSQIWNEAFSGNGNARRFDAGKVGPLTLDQWAIKSNSLARVGMEHLAGNKTKSGSARLSEARDEVEEAFEILGGAGLVHVEKSGRESFRLLPPESWIAARNDLGKYRGTIGRL